MYGWNGLSVGCDDGSDRRETIYPECDYDRRRDDRHNIIIANFRDVEQPRLCDAVSLLRSKRMRSRKFGKRSMRGMRLNWTVLTVAVLLFLGTILAFGCGQYQAIAPPPPGGPAAAISFC